MFINFDDDSSWKYRILGIDNGTNTVGIVILEHDIRTGISFVTRAETFKADRTSGYLYPDMNFYEDTLIARLKTIQRYMTTVLEDEDPDSVAIETPFARRAFVNSYKVLSMSLDYIQTAVYDYRPGLEFVGISPYTAKAAVIPKGSNFKTEKDYIRDCILADPTIVAADGINLRTLDEHSIDAISVARAVALRENLGPRLKWFSSKYPDGIDLMRAD
jgi:Holliday junction resolvasome RuvABC endonuclease subunit